MEKKTIGKFIAALRKVNGMTQRELGEKLFVSDKTVSRWERDECVPELSLLPAIAELFGITTDELLRGERNNPEHEAAGSEDTINKQKAKSDKQFRLMLDKRTRKYKNLTLISVGITILGFLSALVANFAFSEGLIAFCLAAAFGVASEICQIAFAVNARILIDEEDDTYTERIQEANTKAVGTAVKISFFNLWLLASCLPLVMLIDGANYGMVFEFWLGYGILFSLVALVLGHVVYTLFIHNRMQRKGLLTLTQEQRERAQYTQRLLKKAMSRAGMIALILGVGIFVWNLMGIKVLTQKQVFDNCTEFKEFMESDYDRWSKEGFSCVDENGDVIIEIPIVPGIDVTNPPSDKTDAEDSYYPQKTYGNIYNANGTVICEYYFNPDLYHSIHFTKTADDKMPVTVITKQAYSDAANLSRTVKSALYALILMDFVIAAIVYCLKIRVPKKA